MNKLLKSIYYRILWFKLRSHKCYDALDILTIYLKNVEISKITLDRSNYKIFFLDGSRLKFSNCDRWPGWMSNGDMTFHNGKIMSWYDKSPSYETLFKFKNFILNYEKKEAKRILYEEKIKFDDCLPIKLLRKEKLKKITK